MHLWTASREAVGLGRPVWRAYTWRLASRLLSGCATRVVSAENRFKAGGRSAALPGTVTQSQHGGRRTVRGRADSGFAPSQWEMSLQSNAVSHWLGTNVDSALRGVISDIASCANLTVGTLSVNAGKFFSKICLLYALIGISHRNLGLPTSVTYFITE